MAYGIVKVDNITFDNGGSDQNVTVSGLYRATTSGVTVSGTIAATTVSGVTIIGSTTVSGATVTGTTANFTSGNFTNLISAAATMSGALIMANQQQVRFREAVGNGVNHIALQAPAIISADQTITLPDQTGTVVTTGDNGSVTSTMILDGTILNADINASAAIAGTKISPDFGSQTIVTTGVHSAAAGSATTPSIAFTGDLNTGIYSLGADQLAVATNGVGRLFVGASGNVGVGTAAPAQSLDIAGSTGLHLRGSTYTDFSNYWGTNDNRAMFLPYGFLGSSGGFALSLYANGYRNSSSEFTYMGINGNTSTAAGFDLTPDGNIIFRNGTAVGTTLPERLRITSAGLVGIGTSAPESPLHIVNSSAGTANGIELSNFTGNSSYVKSRRSLTLAADFDSNSGTDESYLSFETDAVERVRIDDQGRVGIGTASPFGKLHLQDDSSTLELFLLGPSTGSALIRFGDSADSNIGQIIYDNTSDSLQIHTNNAERLRIDSSGRLLVGTSSARSVGQVTQPIQQESTSDTGIALVRNSSDILGSYVILAKSRGGSVGSNTVVQSGDQLGAFVFAGADGTDVNTQAAFISCFVDGTPGTNDMPGRLVFSTTADGASSPTERMRIDSTGLVSFAADTDTGLSVPTANALGITTGGTERARVSSSGRLSAYSIDGAACVISSSSAAGTVNFLLWGKHSGTAINTGTNAILIYSNGNIVNANNSYGAISDIKLKENIIDATSQWDDIKALQVRKYNFKEETGQQTHTQIGLVAQEVELVSPGLVSESPDRDEEGSELETTTKSINYSVLYMKAVKALQEAMERIEQLEQRLTDAGIA